ncbi:MAG: PEP-CTERM sorting domain-containing protein [Burkholderiales bacterium]|nr:PEP-CTERM sorting domain-containing protein [Burkholderiales bacterium]
MYKPLKTSLAAAVLALAASASQATFINFELAYSGSSFGNSATASGHIVIDDSILPNVAGAHLNVSAASLGIVDWSLTVSGAATGNGTFGIADLAPAADGWVWSLTAPLILGSELVGQAGFSDFNWCAGTASCGNPAAPGGSTVFTIRTAGETGDRLELTSMHATPEPGSLALIGLGLLGLTLRRGRKTPA